jgi:hypothetical protein
VLNPFKFTVAKMWLFILAGLMWSGVGLMLCSLAFRWLVALPAFNALWAGLSGLVFSLVVYRFGFLRIAQKNINRLHAFLEKVSPFAFMSARSYLLVVFMMALGIALRTSPIPRVYLAMLYITIGAALFLSSLHYYPHVWILARRPTENTS